MHRTLRGEKVVPVTDRRRLIVMRHAKAEPFGESDHERLLTARGQADAGLAGRHLVEADLVPDHVVVSDATRAVQTWEQVVAVLADAAASSVVDIDGAVYAAGSDTVLDVLRAVPANVSTLMFVGHNPTASYLCHHLEDGLGDAAALQGLLSGFPPAAFAVFAVAGTWVELDAESGRLVDFFAPA